MNSKSCPFATQAELWFRLVFNITKQRGIQRATEVMRIDEAQLRQTISEGLKSFGREIPKASGRRN